MDDGVLEGMADNSAVTAVDACGACEEMSGGGVAVTEELSDSDEADVLAGSTTLEESTVVRSVGSAGVRVEKEVVDAVTGVWNLDGSTVQ
jgi:hypothetical protein